LLSSAVRSRTSLQAGIFTVANVLVGLLAIVSTAILAQNLTASEFGSYAFALSFLLFVSLIFEFGLFTPAARLTAVADRTTQRDIVGAALVAYIPVGAAFCLTVFALSFGVDHWFHVEAGAALRVAAPAAIAIPFTLIVQQLAQGVDRLHISSISAIIMQLVLVGLLALTVVAGESLHITTAVLLRCASVAAGGAAAALWLRPTFHAVVKWVAELVRQGRAYGFQMYIGRLLSIGTYNMDVLMLGGFANSRSVGFYTIAGSLAAASGLPVTGIATALFARMARTSEMQARWVIVPTCVGAVSALGVWALASPFIGLAFSDRYASAARLVLPLGLAQAVRGVTTVYNTFLSAHGRGRELRNAGLVLTVCNLVLNFVLIPPFGAMGAAWASLFALVANLIAHVAFYRASVGKS
jgi:O-antigen/teichoic acid export membrane protein